MPVFAGGRLVNEMRAAALLSQSAGQRMVRTREELVFNVTRVFYAILAREKMLASLRFSHSALESHLKRVTELIDAEKAAWVDRLRTEVRLADVRQRLVAEMNTLTIQKRLLMNLMGMEATSASLTLRGELEADGAAALLPAEEGVAAAYVRRPDYLAARKELEAQAHRVDVARGVQSPVVGLFAAYGGRWAVNPGQTPSGTHDAEDVGRVGIGVELPLYQGGRIRARIHEERAKLAAAQERLRKLEQQIRLEVETAFLNHESASERIRMLKKSVEQAKESLRIEQQKYELGKGKIVDVLDAQAALLEAETNYYQALADRHVAQAQIRLATGDSTP
jgi:outer membrane protein TolC